MTNSKKVILKVNGIHCGGCANKIKTSLKNLNNELESEVDVTEGLVSVTVDSATTSVSSLKEAIVNVGFEVESIEIE